MQLKYVVVVLVLSALVEVSNGAYKRRSAGTRDKARHEKDLRRPSSRGHSLSFIFGSGPRNTRGKYRDQEAVRSNLLGRGLDTSGRAGRGHGHTAHNDYQDNLVQDLRFGKDQEDWFKNGHHGYIHIFGEEPRAGHRRRHGVDGVLRARRAASTKRPGESRTGGTNFPRGITYTWTRDYSTGKSFDEAAFKSKDKNVIVVLSFDDTLKDANLTASATLYDFTGTVGIMAIKTRSRPGPCFLMETSLTYDKVITELDARNGSSVSTSALTSLDGTGNAVTFSERQALLKKTPSLARQCRGREIVRTKPKGFSPITSEGQTKELKVLTMDAEVTITLPVEPDIDFVPVRQWFQSHRKGPGPGKSPGLGKGRDFWKGQ